MSEIPFIDDAYIDEIIKSAEAYNPALNKTQGVKLRELIKQLRDRMEQNNANVVRTTGDQNITGAKAFVQVSAKELSLVKDGFVSVLKNPLNQDQNYIYTLPKESGELAIKGNFTKADVGLGNVDNTSDADKALSFATQSALGTKADLHYVNVNLSEKAKQSILINTGQGLKGGGNLAADRTISLDETVVSLKSDLTSYQLNSEKGAKNGYASLGADGKVPNSQIPALAISETFAVASQSAMLDITGADQGDVAVRTDLSKSFILVKSPASTLSNWQELLTPDSAVQSVNGKIGNVNLTSTDITEGLNLYHSAIRVNAVVDPKLAAGQSIGANTTGNAATATSAANSMLWNGKSYVDSELSGAMTYLLGYDGANWRPATQSGIRNYLGLGNAAYYAAATGTTPWTVVLRDAGGDVTARSFTGDLYGNASSANQSVRWANQQYISTGNNTFDAIMTVKDNLWSYTSAERIQAGLGLVKGGKFHQQNDIFGVDANAVERNTSSFTYAVNAPYNGALVDFGNAGYGLQLNSGYTGAGQLSFRTFNSDNGTSSPWRPLLWNGWNIDSVRFAGGSGKGYETANIELYSPGRKPNIGFHWPGSVASQIAMASDGTIEILNNPGDGYEKFKAGNITSVNNITVGNSMTISNELMVGSWMRSTTTGRGWYHEVHGGGIMMNDNSWIRTYGNKGFSVDNGDLAVSGNIASAGNIYSANEVRAGSYFKTTSSIGLAGDYDTNGSADKVIWTIGHGWATLATFYGIGYEYEKRSGFGHTINFALNGAINTRVSLNTGQIWTTGDITSDGAVYSGNWFYSKGNAGLYNSTYNNGFRSASVNQMQFYNDLADDILLSFSARGTGNVKGYIHGDSVGNFGILNGAGSWNLRFQPDSAGIFSSSVHAPNGGFHGHLTGTADNASTWAGQSYTGNGYSGAAAYLLGYNASSSTWQPLDDAGIKNSIQNRLDAFIPRATEMLGNGTMNVNGASSGFYRNETGVGGSLPYQPVLNAVASDRGWQLQAAADGSGLRYRGWAAPGTYSQWVSVWSTANFDPASKVNTSLLSTGVSANTVAQRDANGYLFADFINTPSSANNLSSSTPVSIYGNVSGQSYHYSFGAAQVSAFLGLGSFAYRNSINGNEINTSQGNAAVDIGVARNMRWSKFGNGHIIVDNSSGEYKPNTVNSDIAWVAGYPTLMGFNGSSTYGVRVDTARYAETVPWSGVIGAPDLSAYLLKSGGTMTGQLNGTTAVFSGDVTANSDIKLKKNLKVLENASEKLSRIKGYEYDWKSDNKHSIGVVAQEVEVEYPELVKTDNDGMKSVDYMKLVAPLIQAINEHRKEIEELKKIYKK